MRPTRPTVALLLACGLALSACGGGDDEPAARTTQADLPAATTPATVDAPATTAPTASVPATTVAPPATTVTQTATEPSGGTPPPTTTAAQAPTTGGDQPTIAVRGDGTARTTAVDGGQAEIWCDAARQGSYDAQLGSATTLVIAVQGSDQVTRCELPR